MRLGQNVFANDVGEVMPADFTIRRITFAADAVDASRTYAVEVLTDPANIAAARATVASTTVPISTRLHRSAALAVAVSGVVDIGVRIRLLTGTGNSSFGDVSVNVEISIP